MDWGAEAPVFGACHVAATATASKAQTSGEAAKSLKVAISLPNAQTNGVAIAGNRTFMVIAKQKGQDLPQRAE